MRKRTSILSLLSAQKQVWAKQLVVQKNSGQSRWWRKRTLVKAAGGAKELWSKLLSAKKKYGPFVQTVALTRVILRHQLFDPDFFLCR